MEVTVAMCFTFNVPHKSISDSKYSKQGLNGKSISAKTAITLLKAKKNRDANLKKTWKTLMPKTSIQN